jgi:hypothetical protein
VPLTTFTFTQDNAAKLRRISVDHGGTLGTFDLDLPYLESISFEFTQARQHFQTPDWELMAIRGAGGGELHVDTFATTTVTVALPIKRVHLLYFGKPASEKNNTCQHLRAS